MEASGGCDSAGTHNNGVGRDDSGLWRPWDVQGHDDKTR